MIIELFGLSRAGKTTYKEELLSKGYNTIKEPIDIIKSLYFLKFFIKNPINTFYFFYKLNSSYLKLQKFSIINYIKMILMRNSYLLGVLAKCEQAINMKGNVIVDEFSTQSIFMILQKKSSEEEIKKLLQKLPKSDRIYILEIDEKTRYERFKKTRFPAQWIEKEYAQNWMKNSEFNYKIIKKCLKGFDKPKSKLINQSSS